METRQTLLKRRRYLEKNIFLSSSIQAGFVSMVTFKSHWALPQWVEATVSLSLCFFLSHFLKDLWRKREERFEEDGVDRARTIQYLLLPCRWQRHDFRGTAKKPTTEGKRPWIKQYLTFFIQYEYVRRTASVWFRAVDAERGKKAFRQDDYCLSQVWDFNAAEISENSGIFSMDTHATHWYV